MPEYDYVCEACGHEFSDQISISERLTPTKNPCPKCTENGSVIQKIGAPALVSPGALNLWKPKDDFKERMKQIKHGHRRMGKTNIKDY